MENLDEEDRANLRRLWLTRGGEADDLREFHRIVREAGVQVAYYETTAFMRQAPLAPETKERMEELWAERQMTGRELYNRLKEA